MPFPDSATQSAVLLTVRLAACTTLLLLLIATPLAWVLARSRARWSAVLGAVVALPLVLPPTVLGFYALMAMGPQGWLGQLTQSLGLGTLAFTFAGLLLGSVVYSLPFAVQPIQHAFEAMGPRPMEVAATLGLPPLEAFWRVALPIARPGFAVAAVLSFAHTVGEFGLVLMIGGNIPGQTQVISTLIYGHVEAMEYPQAHALSLGMVGFAFVVLLALGVIERRAPRLVA
jgi:molybdate transport system permease protein